MAIHLLGIRHHGPGSCRNVLNYLQELQPDLILVEGPAEAESAAALCGKSADDASGSFAGIPAGRASECSVLPFCGVLARVAGDALCRTEPDTFPLFRLAPDLFAGSSGTKDL